MAHSFRDNQWNALAANVFDVAIIGGGINGACLYYHLCKRGFSVFLVDKGDFAGGTSQASAMMIWGGALYLRNGRLLTVRNLCHARDRMMCELGDWIKPCRFRYVPDTGKESHLVHAALQLYWLIGGCRRLRPRCECGYSEQTFLKRHGGGRSLVYEEASVGPSDARFVLHWLHPYQNGVQIALNYCSVEGGGIDRKAREWRLDVHDLILDRRGHVRARWIVNAAGPWTDAINDRFGVRSPYQHVLSKGVFIGLKRDPRHRVPLLFGTRDHGVAMAFIPWGPVSLWGPTETIVNKPTDGYTVRPKDVRILLDELNAHLAHPVTSQDIVSLRCGVRPLAVERSMNRKSDPLDISRWHRIHRDEHLPWVSVYGGKLTNCVSLAETVVDVLERAVSPSVSMRSVPRRTIPPITMQTFPGLPEPVPAPRWCADWEMCWTLEDYLRRRTNVSQWVPRCGFGRRDEHVPYLLHLSTLLCGKNGRGARQTVDAYRKNVVQAFDKVLADC